MRDTRDADGVWCARAAGQGGAGSSAEHARTVGGSEMETEAEKSMEAPMEVGERVE